MSPIGELRGSSMIESSIGVSCIIDSSIGISRSTGSEFSTKTRCTSPSSICSSQACTSPSSRTIELSSTELKTTKGFEEVEA